MKEHSTTDHKFSVTDVLAFLIMGKQTLIISVAHGIIFGKFMYVSILAENFNGICNTPSP